MLMPTFTFTMNNDALTESEAEALITVGSVYSNVSATFDIGALTTNVSIDFTIIDGVTDADYNGSTGLAMPSTDSGFDITQFDGLALKIFAFNGYYGSISATDEPYFYTNSSLAGMFYNSKNGNLNIGHWTTTNVTNMAQTFHGSSNFNHDIGNWVTDNVTNMAQAFYKCTIFNQDLNWNTGNVTTMWKMFSHANAFNGNITNWDTANVTNMYEMFSECTVFNQDLNWNTGNVTDMNLMFQGALSFNKNIGNLDFTSVVTASNMLTNSGLDYNTYSSYIQDIGNNTTVPDNLDLGVNGFARIDNTATNDAYTLLTNKGVTILDNGFYLEMI